MTHMHGATGVALLRWIGIAMVLPALGAVVMFAGNASLAIRNVDQAALEREASGVKHGVQLLGELLATEQTEFSTWDEAFENVITAPDTTWMKDYFGSTNFPDPDEQHMVIVNNAGAAIYSSEYDAPLPRDRQQAVLAAAQPIMKRVRETYRKIRFDDNDFSQRQAGALTDGVYASDVAIIDGRPAMITVSPFLMQTSEETAPKEPTYLIGINFMTEELMARLAAMAHVDKLELVKGEQASPAAKEPTSEIRQHVLVLQDMSGNPVATVKWPVTLPGSAVLKAQLPVLAATLALIGVLTLCVTVAMHRLSKRVSASEQAALHASRHDAATGLANRRWFMEAFAELLKPAKRPDAMRSRALLLIDCDYFKAVNDTLGHAAGDAVLAAVAERMKGLGENVAIAARLGGDEFTLISGPLAGTGSVASFAESVSKAIMRPVMFEGRTINVSVSIGGAQVPAETGQSIDALLAEADLALYRAKRDGRGCSRIYDPAIDKGDAAIAPAAATRPTLNNGALNTGAPNNHLRVIAPATASSQPERRLASRVRRLAKADRAERATHNRGQDAHALPHAI